MPWCCGDWNIAHTENDIKNWKGNIKKSGFLPQRAAVAHRSARRRDGWTWSGGCIPTWPVRTRGGRGGAGHSTTTPAGASTTSWPRPGLAARASAARVERAAAYALRWSDHAPVTVEYALTPVRLCGRGWRSIRSKSSVPPVLDGGRERRPGHAAEVAVGHGKSPTAARPRRRRRVVRKAHPARRRRPSRGRRSRRSGSPSPSRRGTPRRAPNSGSANGASAVPSAANASEHVVRRLASRRRRGSALHRVDARSRARQTSGSAPRPLAAAANPRCWTVMWAKRSARFEPAQGVGRSQVGEPDGVDDVDRTSARRCGEGANVLRIQ